MCIFKEGKGKDGESKCGECVPHCTAQQYAFPTLTLPILSSSFLKNTHAYIEVFFQRNTQECTMMRNIAKASLPHLVLCDSLCRCSFKSFPPSSFSFQVSSHIRKYNCVKAPELQELQSMNRGSLKVMNLQPLLCSACGSSPIS